MNILLKSHNQILNELKEINTVSLFFFLKVEVLLCQVESFFYFLSNSGHFVLHLPDLLKAKDPIRVFHFDFF